MHTTEKEHVLVCLSSSPSNAKIIKTAAQMATAFNCKLTALYVKTSSYDSMSKDNRGRLQKHIRQAEDLGAEIETAYGDDVAEQIVEFAKMLKVTKVVLGRSTVFGKKIFNRQTLTDRLIKSNLQVDIHIIPDTETKKVNPFYDSFSSLRPPSLKEWFSTFLFLLLSTVIGLAFSYLGCTNENVIAIYMLGVLISSLVTKNHISSIVFSLLSVLSFGFFFIEPKISFKVYQSGYLITFIVMLIVSLISGTLVNKLATNTRLSANTSFRTNIMLETNRLLQKAETENELIEVVAKQLKKLLSRNIVIYPVSNGNLSSAMSFLTEDDYSGDDLLEDYELSVALEVLKNRKSAGAGTDNMNDAKGIYHAVKTADEVFYVVGIHAKQKPLEPFENSILISLFGEWALALDSLKKAKEKEQIALIAEKEQLRANLLRSISHDLRTPLTSIYGNTENLLMNFDNMDELTRKQILSDTCQDTEWLISLVENLLAISRLNDGKMNVNLSNQLIEEVITEALRHVNKKASEHIITTEFSEDLLLAKIDARLISQVVINLVDNAIKYTQNGSKIKISAIGRDGLIFVSVADDGKGIPDEQKENVFQMFYTGNDKVSDCRRSMGIGLALCKSIVEFHGGKITLTDNEPTGSIFTFTLKQSEVNLNE